VGRALRFRLVAARLGAVLDSMDVCQSVLASFFVRAAAGAFDLDDPDQVLRLLVIMARNKLASQARKQRAVRRDQRRVNAASEGQQEVVAPPPPPPPQGQAPERFGGGPRRGCAGGRRGGGGGGGGARGGAGERAR